MAIRKEIVGSLVPVLFGAGFLLYDTQYPLDNWANPGPAVFPFLVGSVLVILSVWQLVRASRKPKPERSKAKIPSVKGFLQSNKGKMKALLMIAVFIVYLLMVQWVGFFVSNFLFVVTSSRLMKARDWERASCSFRRGQPFLLPPFRGLAQVILSPRDFILKGGMLRVAGHGVLSSLLITFQPVNFFACFIGAVVGTLVGVLPGLGPAAAMALVIPLTLKLGPTAGLIMLAGIYYGSMYGGSTTSILVNVPGEPASVVTTIDGYAMARKGRAGAALAIAAIGSFVCRDVQRDCAPVLRSPPGKVCPCLRACRILCLTVLGVVLLSNLTGKSRIKSLIMMMIGLMLSPSGWILWAGVDRFSFRLRVRSGRGKFHRPYDRTLRGCRGSFGHGRTERSR